MDGNGVNAFGEGGCYDCWQPRQFMASAKIHGKRVSGSCVTHLPSGARDQGPGVRGQGKPALCGRQTGFRQAGKQLESLTYVMVVGRDP